MAALGRGVGGRFGDIGGNGVPGLHTHLAKCPQFLQGLLANIDNGGQDGVSVVACAVEQDRLVSWPIGGIRWHADCVWAVEAAGVLVLNGGY